MLVLLSLLVSKWGIFVFLSNLLSPIYLIFTCVDPDLYLEYVSASTTKVAECGSNLDLIHHIALQGLCNVHALLQLSPHRVPVPEYTCSAE